MERAFEECGRRLIMMVAIRIVGLLYGLIVLSVANGPLQRAYLGSWPQRSRCGVYQGLLNPRLPSRRPQLRLSVGTWHRTCSFEGLASSRLRVDHFAAIIGCDSPISLGIATLAFLGRGRMVKFSFMLLLPGRVLRVQPAQRGGVFDLAAIFWVSARPSK